MECISGNICVSVSNIPGVTNHGFKGRCLGFKVIQAEIFVVSL